MCLVPAISHIAVAAAPSSFQTEMISMAFCEWARPILFEDVKFMGGFRLATRNLSDYDVLFSFMNYRKRLDWGAMVYRTNEDVGY